MLTPHMNTNHDLTFITNEKERNLLERFKVLIKDTQFFDALVGYFYTSGFHAIYKSLEHTDKIRILIGISTDQKTFDSLQEAKEDQQEMNFSHAEVKETFSGLVTDELENSEDSREVEDGVLKFIEWLKSGKLEIKAYPSANIHAKLYVMTFADGDRDAGRVITGSSNFTRAGLIDNLEFNVELKTRADYDYALQKFNELWVNAVDVSDKYIETIEHKTWLSNAITPYQLYLKFLYEYFKEKINVDQESIFKKYLPENFLDLEYQTEAVKDAKAKLEEYGGVFIADVVGLGKTYISAMLAQQLDGRSLVIAPPVLLDKENPGSWPNVFSDFRVHADFESLGKLDKLSERGTDKYKNIFIDEAHRFRNETNFTYEKLAQVCRGKRIILVSATPLNNTPRDILGLIKLFQKSKKSTIPNIADLESFFSGLEKKLKNLDRQKDYEKYLQIVKSNAQEIRDKVLKYLMVRRTRSEIIKYFADDLSKQKLKFPDVEKPEAVLYELDDNEDEVFNTTIKLLLSKFEYSRYVPYHYYKGEKTQSDEMAQINNRRFLKILMIKRLESSFYAFNKSLERFIHSYEQFITEFDKGSVYVSKKFTNKIFEFLEDDNDIAIQKLIDEDKATKLDAKDFEPQFQSSLIKDLEVLKEISKLWESVKRDPKLLTFIKILSENEILKNNKLILFTESKETAEYLEKNLQDKFDNKILLFTGSSSALTREKVIGNFDAKARLPKDDYRILITTEILAEGVNLHRSCVVINYDIPWNPTRLIQRVGRINRVDTKFPKIYTFNFFPTKQSNNLIKLKEAAEYKIQAFIEMLGADARLLTDGEEIKSHDLFRRLTSKETLTQEGEAEDSDLKYLKVIRDLRDNQPDMFEKIKRLPKKARTARASNQKANGLLTYFRKGKIQKFYLADTSAANELDFVQAAKVLEATIETKQERFTPDFYQLLEFNKKEFQFATTDQAMELATKAGRDNASTVLRYLKSKQIKDFKGYTDEDEDYIKRLIKLLEEGGLPKQTTKTLVKELSEETNPLKILGILKTNIAEEFFQDTLAESGAKTAGPREVILSELLTAK
jgi:superfamily II DNA/RNA helicase